MSIADLEGVITQPSNRGASTTMMLHFQGLEVGVTIYQTIVWPIYHAARVADSVVQTFDLEAPSMANLKLRR